jgi:hypothetical protein
MACTPFCCFNLAMAASRNFGTSCQTSPVGVTTIPNTWAMLDVTHHPPPMPQRESHGSQSHIVGLARSCCGLGMAVCHDDGEVAGTWAAGGVIFGD